MQPKVAHPRILIVDDDEVLLGVLSRMVTREGYVPMTAANSTAALESARKEPPQLALLDLCLSEGDGDGVGLARELKARQPGLPVLLMTAYPMPDPRYPNLDEVFSQVLPKPIGLEDFRKAISNALDPDKMTKETLPTPEIKKHPPATAPSPAIDAALKPAKGSRGNMVKKGLFALVLLGALGLGLAFTVGVPGFASNREEKTALAAAPLNVELVPGLPHTIHVPEDVRVALGIGKGHQHGTVAAVRPTASRPLVLPGTTALDPARLIRIRARFAPAQVEKIGTIRDLTPSGMESEARELRSGDRVKKDETVLGVFYSVDVAAKKNDLVDGLVQMRLDRQLLDRLEILYKSGSGTEVGVLSARRNVETDRNAISRALNTLRIWNIPVKDIDAVYEEAEEIGKRQGKRDPDKAKEWGRVELKAPADGIIVERNVAQNEVVVDTTVNLFQIAQVDRLVVVVNAPEDDLPTLLNLPPHRRNWTIQTVGTTAAAGIPGSIDEIGYIIDVNQHSAVVKGHIDNRDGRLRAGQFVSASIALPPPEDVVEIPVKALVDDGRQCVVFVQSDPAKPRYTLRRVEVTQRFDKSVFVRGKLPAEQPALTPEEKALGLLPPQALRPGERVLTAGVLELKKELEDREGATTTP